MEDLKEKQTRNLKGRLEQLETQMAEKIKSSNYAYEHGGDGWHDNASWESLYQEITVLKLMIRNTKKALQVLEEGQ